MAEKSFGVKEVNLIGASGTPTITSPNNLNLNAVNVAISTNATIGGNLSVSGTVGIAGTLTYEDVTNIDSVGIITAQKDIHVGAGLSVVGVSTLTGAVNSSANITTTLDLNSRYLYVKDIFMEDVSPELRFVDTDNDPNYRIRLNSGLLGIRDITNNVDKLVFNTSGMVATGIVTATTFSGSGASLTNLPLSNTDVQVLYTLTANGSSAYRFAGNGIVSTEDNPDVYLIRGLKYRFVNNSGGSHPFQIRQSSGGSAYSAGVTNNGAASGNIDFQVPYSAPSRLYYQCTAHGGMVGNLYIRGAGGQNDNVGVTTFSGAVNVTAAITADDFRTDSSSSTLYLTSANDWRFRTTSGHERLRIDSNGRILIGHDSTPQAALSVAVVGSYGGSSTNTPFVYICRDEAATAITGGESLGQILFASRDGYRGAVIEAKAAGVWSESSSDGYLVFKTTPDNTTVPTEKLRITSNGNVGIGTDNPSKQLSIYGDSDTCIRVTSSAGGAASLQLGDTSDTVKGAITFLNSDNSLRIRGYNNDDRMVITSDAKVKINVPNSKVGVTTGGLDIWGDATSYPTLRLGSIEIDEEGEHIRFARTDISTDIRYHSIFGRHSSTTGNNYLAFKLHDGSGSPYTAQREVLRFQGDGNIYTSNDQVRDNARLTITNNVVGVSTSIHLHNANGSGTATKISASKSIILSADFDANSGANSSYISFETDATEKLRITSDGNVHHWHNSHCNLYGTLGNSQIVGLWIKNNWWHNVWFESHVKFHARSGNGYTLLTIGSHSNGPGGSQSIFC